MKKKVLIIVSVAALVLSGSVGVLAAGGTNSDPGIGKSAVTDRQEQRMASAIRLHRLFEEYYPEGLDALAETREAHREFHQEAAQDREELKQSIQEARQEIAESLKNGDIDRKEARDLVVEFRKNVESMKTEFMGVMDEKRAAQEPIRERLVEIRGELKDLLTADPVDSDAVKALLEESLGLFKQHLDNDIYYHDILVDIAEAHGF